jgi:threonine/homoserine/homoserine lactone efflux protein
MLKFPNMMPTASFIAVFIFSFGMAIGAVLTPGPVTTAIVSQSPRLGWVTGPLVSVGHALLELLMVLLIVFGLSTVLGTPAVQTAIALLGGLLLLWMGGGMLAGALRGRLRLPEPGQAHERLDYRKLLGLGAAASLTNPFWYAWWMTAAAAFLLQAKAAGLYAVAGFYLGHISADFLWNTALSTLVGGSKNHISQRVYAGLISACGIFLVYLAVRFLVAGIRGVAG